MRPLLDRGGSRITLGERLGAGGEGSVYTAPSAGRNVVAKIYHQPIPPAKQRKLEAMAKAADARLLAVACWPIGTVHDAQSRAVCGFLMPRMVGHVPLHDLYGPSHRKQRHPDKDWAFLVSAARNTAAAFEAVHAHGHVIGDVNPNLVNVAGDSTVKLIDCDSFQIVADGTPHLCEVGVGHFTPPELQSIKSFRDVRRTANHDAFGLALLIFHLLLMGRHPFAGICSGSAETSLEKSIEHFRYAFGPSASAKGMKPPPRSVAPDILPPVMAAHFERAFTEIGIRPPGRPTARDWVSALDQLRMQLRACGRESAHKYFGGLAACPWCTHESRHAVYFFVAVAAISGAATAFDLDAVWRRIIAVTGPGAAPRPESPGPAATPRPLSPQALSSINAARTRRIAAVVIFGLALLSQQSVIIVVGLVTAFIMFVKGADQSAERSARRRALDLARQNLASRQKQWESEAGEGAFQKLRAELERHRQEYMNLKQRLLEERSRLSTNLRDVKLEAFLDGIFIDRHEIRNIGPARKATLASYGIETAADIKRSSIIRIHGFGPSLTQDLLNWRRQMEQRFVFDPSRGVDPADLAALNQRFTQERRQLEGNLLAGPERLNQAKNQILQRRNLLLPQVQAAMAEVRQAEADLRAVL